jgi:hypothetical protein
VSTSTRCRNASFERLHAGLLGLAALPDEELHALVGGLLAGTGTLSSRFGHSSQRREQEGLEDATRGASDRPLTKQKVHGAIHISIRDCEMHGESKVSAKAAGVTPAQLGV